MRRREVLVTGAGGLIGKAIVRNLLRNGFSVRAFLRPGALTPFYPDQNLRIFRGSMENWPSLVGALKGCDAVINLAANQYHPKLSYVVNVQGAENLITAMKSAGVKRLIQMSTLATRLAHKGVYGKTKSQADELIKNSGLDWTILKPSLVYGEDPKTIFTTIAGFVKSLPFVPVLGNGQQPFRPVWTEDVAEAVTRVLRSPRTLRKEYDLGSKESLTLNGLIRKIQKVLGKDKQPIVHVPYLLSLVGALTISELMKDPPISVDNVLGSNQPTCCRPKKSFRDLKWRPIGVDEGIQKVLIEEKRGKLPVAIVGLGKMGTLHGAILSTFPDVQITALIDKDKKLGKTVLSMGIEGRFYPDLDTALVHEKVAAVFITTPTFAHREVIEVCLKRKLPFFVEKPVFPKWSQYFELGSGSKPYQGLSNISHPEFISGSRKMPKRVRHDTVLIDHRLYNLTTASGYFYSFRRPYGLARKLIARGVLGKIKSYQAKLLISEVFKEKHGWIFRKELSGGGVLANPGPHVFGVLEKFFGSPAKVWAKTKRLYSREVEDEAAVKLTYKNGLRGEIFASWSVKGVPLTSVSVTVVGEGGTMEVNEEGVSLKAKKAINIVRYIRDIKVIKQNGAKETFIPVSQISGPKEPTFVLSPAAGGEGYTLEDRAFIDCVKAGKTHPNNLEFAARVEKAISLCYLSAETGQEVKSDLSN